MQILGIVNITRDSFSDGGRYLAPEAATAHARQLRQEGADLLDLGAESTHPDAEDVSAAEEIARLTPVVRALRAEGARVSIDTYKAEVMRAMLALGVEMINDVTALADPEAVAAVRAARVRVILMHSTGRRARAERRDEDAETIVARIVAFFRQRVADLERQGVAREQLILDPGLGFFLGRAPELSVRVLRELKTLRALGLPLCLCPSRKSFLGELLRDERGPRAVAERGAGTLAAELWALHCGAAYIRTHAVRALRDAATVWAEFREGAAGRGPDGA